MADGMAADARLAGIAGTQLGVFTRAQAIAAGFGASRIDRRVRAGVWVRVLPRVYRHASTPGSPALSHWAAVLWAGTGCVLSHTSAAAIWRITVAGVDRPELIVPASRAPRSPGVIAHRVQRIDAVDVRVVGRLPVTAPARTIVDLAGVVSDDELETALQRARARNLVTFRALSGRLDDMGTAGRPGAARLRELLRAIGSGEGRPSARMSG